MKQAAQTLMLSMIPIALLLILIHFLVQRHLKKVCTKSVQGTLVSAERMWTGSRAEPYRLECRFYYRVDGQIYHGSLRAPSRQVRRLDQIREPTLEVNYNPKKPYQYWIDPYEKSRIGG